MNGPVLRGIHLPAASWWPLAPGWWAVVVIVVLIAAAIVFGLWRHRRRGALRSALAELDRLRQQYVHDGDADGLVDGASRLMRRVARRVDADAAAAPGAAWQAFVDRYARGEARSTLQALVDSRYRAQPAIDADALLVALNAWCRRALGRRTHREGAAT